MIMYNTTELSKALMVLFAPIIKEAVLSTINEYSNSLIPTGEKQYTREEFAKRKGVTTATLWRWEKQGLLKGKRVGQRVYYRDSDLVEL